MVDFFTKKQSADLRDSHESYDIFDLCYSVVFIDRVPPRDNFFVYASNPRGED